MAMTPEQLHTLAAAIASETDPEFVELRGAGATGAMAEWYNLPHASARAWRSDAKWPDVADAIEYAKYTPSTANTPADTPGLCRMMAILIKLQVQQNMLLAMRDSMDARHAGNVLALLDSVIAVPAGVAGANVAPGGVAGVNVANALARPATRAEALYITSSPSFGTVTASLMSFEGAVSNLNIVDALALQ